MPKSSLDWLAVVSAWVGSIVLAFKSWNAPLMPGAPDILASNFWNFVPAGLITLALVLFIYRQARPLPPMAASPAPMPASEPDLDQKGCALLSLSNARDTAGIALWQREDDSHERAFHEVEAAMLSVAQEFGIKMLSFGPAEDRDFTQALKTYEAYIDCFYPMLREGHITAAKAKAADFKRANGC